VVCRGSRIPPCIIFEQLHMDSIPAAGRASVRHTRHVHCTWRSIRCKFMQAAHTTRLVEQGAARAAEALNASLVAEVAELRLGNAALREQVIHQ